MGDLVTIRPKWEAPVEICSRNLLKWHLRKDSSFASSPKGMGVMGRWGKFAIK